MPMTPDEVAAWLANPPSKKCSKCGKVKSQDEFPYSNDNRCKDCRREYDAARYAGDSERQRRLRIQNATTYAIRAGYTIVEDVDLEVVYERDSGICQICRKPVDWSLDRRRNRMGATLDHIAPIHSYATVQLAHGVCNTHVGGLIPMDE